MNKKILTGIAAVCAAAGMTSSVVSAEKASGVTAEIMDPAPAQERVYCVGSVSKIYVTAAVMQLADEGRVDIDAPVTDYIPDFTMADERYRDITVRMLMDHTSGIEGSIQTNEELYGDNDMSNYDIMLEMLSHQRLKADPGEYVAYCNTGFDLLQMIVENVSGMSYTDYVKENISAKIGAEHTGTPLDMFGRDDLAPIYCFGNIPHDYEYCMSLGSGGVYATASDATDFGGAFFTGDSTLLSDKAKNEMATRWNNGADEYMDGNGLGWDYVEKLHYEQSGVKVMGKGGDIGTMHAFLMVAPDEEISISVLSAGGGSNYNELMAQALLDTVLDERGKAVDKNLPDIQIADSIPDACRKYEGCYTVKTASGSGVMKLYFDDDMMYTENVGKGNTSITRYKPTTDNGFVKVDEKGNITADRTLMHFAEKNGKVYIKGEMTSIIPGLGESTHRQYSGERIEENRVTDAVRAKWAERSGRLFVLYNNKYSSSSYDKPFFSLDLDDGLDGYCLCSAGPTFKIIGENKLEFFTTTPSSANRDVMDIDLYDTAFSDGTTAESINTSCGNRYRFADELPVLTKSVSEVKLNSDEAQWYRIGEDIAGGSLTAERPEKSTICVYNKFGELVYTTHMKDASAVIPLPDDGYILFHGETGGSVKVYR